MVVTAIGLTRRLDADATFDIWSFAVVAYRALARELLFKSDDSDNAPIAELDRIFKWNHATLDQSVRKLQRFLVSGGLLMGGAFCSSAILCSWQRGARFSHQAESACL